MKPRRKEKAYARVTPIPKSTHVPWNLATVHLLARVYLTERMHALHARGPGCISSMAELKEKDSIPIGHTRFEFCLCVELSAIVQAPSLLSLSFLGFWGFGLVVVSYMESH